MKRRILFVDDDSNILQGLQRMLRSMRGEWDMDFANSSQDAFAHLAQAPYDVIVSDVKMPGMDGVELLTAVRSQYPQMTRLLLTGQAGEETILKAVGPAHQFLSKPCDADMLKTTISRTCALSAVLEDPTLKELASQMVTIPTLPSLYAELVRTLEDPESTLERISTIVEKDMGMTAKILKLVNSAFFGLPRQISSPSQAISYLGIETLKTLVLTVQVFEELTPQAIAGFSVEALWEHSIQTGEYARRIAQAEGLDNSLIADTLTAGMLHDVGALLLASQLPDQFTAAIELSNTQHISLHVAEQQIMSASHAELGGYLLGLWGLRHPVVEAVAFHHQPKKLESQQFTPLTAVHIANALHTENMHTGQLRDGQGIQEDYIDSLNLTGHLSTWREICNASGL
ncbi:MAG: signal transduction protein [Nitrospirales bacterium]|nr:MAG: signal transduction protein [Nitrospirales bacterium]